MRHVCPICGKTSEIAGTNLASLALICVDCYLSPRHFLVMNAGLLDSGNGLLDINLPTPKDESHD